MSDDTLRAAVATVVWFVAGILVGLALAVTYCA